MSQPSNVVDARIVTQAIRQYFEAVSTMCPSVGARALELAKLGAMIQSSPDTDGRLGRFETAAMRLCDRDDVDALRAFYYPTPPTTDIIGYSEQIVSGSRHGKTVALRERVAKMRRRDATDAEAAAALGCHPHDARRRLHEAREKVRQALLTIVPEESAS